MKKWNILDRQLETRRSYLVEASAGTGKTFAIEHLVTRLLMEIPKTSIDRLLVVTFTKAATTELKQRIQKNLLASIEMMEQLEKGEKGIQGIPDYLLFHMEKGHSLLRLRHLLKQALLHFDESSITTIHGFCHKMLLEHRYSASIHPIEVAEDLLSSREIRAVIHDFFRTKLKLMDYSPGQLEIVLKENQGEVQRVEEVLCRLVMRGEEIHPDAPSFGALFDEWCSIMKEIKRDQKVGSSTCAEDFLLLAPAYYDLCDRKKQVKGDVEEEIRNFCRLFDQDTWSIEDFDAWIRHGAPLLAKFDPSCRKPDGRMPGEGLLHHPSFLSYLQKTLEPLLKKASHYAVLLGRMANDCRQMLLHYAVQEEKFLYDDLLKEMQRGIQDPHFLLSLRRSFDAVIIDEFQDTDPLQWSVFEQIFLSSQGQGVPVYLVGDPKQSIYGFRKADIYTYLRAAQTLGADHAVSLDTNWRSQPRLVHALNALFSKDRFPSGFPLPRTKGGLAYHPVQAGVQEGPPHFSDGKGSLHFCLAIGKRGREKRWPSEHMERNDFFPYLVQEIRRLRVEDGISFHEWAVLVRDRFQADRVASYLQENGIPSWSQRQEILRNSRAVPALREWIFSVLHPCDFNALKVALTGSLFQGGSPHIQALENGDVLNGVYRTLYSLRQRLLHEGIGPFFHQWMQSTWFQSPRCVEEQLLQQEGGGDLYRELLQLVDLLAEDEKSRQESPYQLLRTLEDLERGVVDDEEERWIIKKDAVQEGVKILTLHMSKGLEFGIVFALGLVNRTPTEELFVIDASKEHSFLKVVQDPLDPSLGASREEGDAEKLRQFYVAATRAKWRTYLPVALEQELPLKIAQGTASPMELYLAYGKTSTEPLYEKLSQEEGKELCAWINGLSPDVGIRYEEISLRRGAFSNARVPKKEEAPLLLPLDPPPIQGKKQGTFSFSSLLRLSQEEETFTPKRGEPLKKEKNVHTLPVGSDTGTLLHRILEEIPFHLALTFKNQEELLPIVEPYLKRSSLEGWERVVCEIILNALTFPIFDEDKDFCLARLSSEEMYREMEFLYSFDQQFMRAPHLPTPSGYLKGVIDLIFMKEGKIYLLDWKSNWLGTALEDYSLDRMEEVMKLHHYDWQQSIYCEALKRYAALVDSRNFSACFGGVFYIFLRGLDPLKSNRNGIYFLK